MEYKADLEQSQRRVEARWNREIVDRVVVQLPAPRKPAEAAKKLICCYCEKHELRELMEQLRVQEGSP